MKFRGKYRIESARLKNYDYSCSGMYFITICTQDRQPFFGKVVNSKMQLSDAGRIAVECWQEIPNHFLHVQLDEYAVMPNHVHGILIIDKDNVNVETRHGGLLTKGHSLPVETQNFAPHHIVKQRRVETRHGGLLTKGHSLPVETQNFASLPTTSGNEFGPQSKNLASIIRGFKIGVKKWTTENNISFQWQPRYYDRIIRNDKELYNIREYIQNNPLKWEMDRNNWQNLYM